MLRLAELALAVVLLGASIAAGAHARKVVLHDNAPQCHSCR